MGEYMETMPGIIDKAYLTVALGAYIMWVPPLLPGRFVPILTEMTILVVISDSLLSTHGLVHIQVPEY